MEAGGGGGGGGGKKLVWERGGEMRDKNNCRISDEETPSPAL